jgi:glutaminyl-tRNA synthetase
LEVLPPEISIYANMSTEEPTNLHFIRQIIADDLGNGKHDEIVTRFPPEPNGYLHIGHAKAICLDFTMAAENGGRTHLRFDDTNPAKEDVEFVDSIKEDVRWLGFDWGEHEYYASSYFEQLHDYAVQLIETDKAYVCTLNTEEFAEYRGTLTEPGTDSPHRNRPVAESLDLFARMRAGEFADGEYVLRAKIDMTSPNLHMRDPVIYRIKHAHHHQTGDEWCIYPMYDFAHGLSDSIEGITHSLCTLEFEVHRPLYDWFLEVLEVECRPRQIEFARLDLGYTIMSKRKLQLLVEDNHVSGWDDPRMPTISGLRRRGYTPEAIREFCEVIGVTKVKSKTDVKLLESIIRDDLNKTSPRVMAVLDPIKLVITNWPGGKIDELEAINNPEDESAGKRVVPFSGELYIERGDFMEDPPKKFFRLGPGREVRLRYGYYVTCTGFTKDEDGNVTEVQCTYDPESRGGSSPDGRRVRGTIHWVSTAHAVDIETRMYDRLFTVESPDADSDVDFLRYLNPDSLQVITAKGEPSIAHMSPGARCQFERKGYFCRDTVDSGLVFNQTVALRDSWAKKQGK